MKWNASSERQDRSADAGRIAARIPNDFTVPGFSGADVQVRAQRDEKPPRAPGVSVIADNTEHGLAEEKFRLAVEACPNGMVMIDGANNMVMVNTEIEQQFGYMREELIGQTIDMLVPARLRNHEVRYREAFNRRQEARAIGVDRNLFGLRKDGSEFPIEVGLTPIRSANGPLVLGVIVDASERKRIERLKDEFVSTVSHELRTPMTSISGSLGLLIAQWRGTLPEPAERLLVIAHKNSQRLVRLINDILDIEKMESGQVEFRLSKVEVLPLAEQVIDDNRGFAEEYSVRMRLDPASVNCQVNADPDRLAQVLTNLLSNAIKFSPPNEEVLVAIRKDGETIQISVQDHGCGVPADFRPQLFEKFAQADATNSRQKGGTGLGLSIVKQIVDRLGGRVSVNDAGADGTIFCVELPVWKRVADQDVDCSADKGAARVLLCEDDRETAIVMRQSLQRAGFAVDCAFTTAATAALVEQTSYAAFIVDLQFPDGDGIGLILHLRGQQQYRDTPIVVVSGNPSHGRDDTRSSTLNVLGWLSKPVDFERLVQFLSKSIAPALTKRPQILHVDDDRGMRTAVTQALYQIADVISAGSIAAAHEALASNDIDLAVIDIAIEKGSGLDLLPDLRNSFGKVIPVIIFSANGSGLNHDEQIHSAFEPHQSLDKLVASVRDRLALLLTRTAKEGP